MNEMIESEICRALKFILIITIIPTFLFYCAIYNGGKSVGGTETGAVTSKHEFGTTTIPKISIPPRFRDKEPKGTNGLIKPGGIERVEKLPKNVSISKLSKGIRKFFEDYYKNKGASIIFTTDDDDNKDFIVESLRGEVIKGSKFWEKLQISVTLSQRKHHIFLKLITTGKYSAGFKPPGVKGYKDMGDGYSTQLKNYVGEILTKLKEYILSD